MNVYARPDPFFRCPTLTYLGAKSGPDLFANFQEDRGNEPVRCASFEVENNFYSYKSHGHYPGQYPKVICWDIPTSGRKVRLSKTGKKYKFTTNMEEYQVHIDVLKLMDGIADYSRKELRDMEIDA